MKKILLFAIMLVGLSLLTVSVPAFAYNALEGADCVNGAGSAVCNHGAPNDPLTGNDGALAHIANIVVYVAGVAAVIIIIVSGLRYLTSGGDSSATESAKKTIIGAVIGLAVIVLAKTIITYVVQKL